MISDDFIDCMSMARKETDVCLNASKLDLRFVSVVVVSWNKNRKLQELIDSIVKQKYERKEIIVVYNASYGWYCGFFKTEISLT